MKKLLTKIDWRAVFAAFIRYAATFYAGGQIIT